MSSRVRASFRINVRVWDSARARFRVRVGVRVRAKVRSRGRVQARTRSTIRAGFRVKANNTVTPRVRLGLGLRLGLPKGSGLCGALRLERWLRLGQG